MGKLDKRLVLFALWIIIVGVLPFGSPVPRDVLKSSAEHVSSSENYLFLGFSLGLIVIVFGVIVWGIINKKAMAYLAAMGIVFHFIMQEMKFFTVFGFYGESFRTSLTLFALFISILFLFDQKIRAQFAFKPEHLKVQKVAIWVFVIVMMGGLVSYGIFILPHKNEMKDRLLTPIQVRYSLPPSVQWSEEYRKIETPRWSFLLPRRIDLENETPPGKKGLVLVNRERSIFIFFDVEVSSLTDDTKIRMDIVRLIGIKTKYEMVKKSLYEQFGSFFLIHKARTLERGIKKIYDIRTDHLKGFMFQTNISEKNLLINPELKNGQSFYYLLFTPEDQTLNILFLANPQVISEQEINDMIASIEVEK